MTAAIFLAVSASNVRATLPFTAGNLAVLSADLATTNNTTFTILELSPAANQVSPATSVPISGTSATPLRTSGSATSTGYLSGSDDGSLMAFDGFNSTAATGNANTITARGVGTLNNAGTFNLAATYTGTSGNQARGATTINNSHFYIADQAGVFTNGSGALNTANVRCVKSFGGALYVLQASTTAIVVSSLTTDGRTLTALPGMAADSAAQDFYLVSSGSNGSTYDVLYVLTTAGIKKYSLVSGTWTANASYATVTGFGLCAAKSGSGAVLYVTTGSGATAANNLVKVTDTVGFNTAITVVTANNVTLYTAAAGTTMKGVTFAPISTLAVNNTGTPAAGSIATGATSVSLFGFQLIPSGSSAIFTALKLTTAGTAASSDLSNFRVVYDANNNGAFDAGEPVISSSAQSLANPINFPITSQTISGASNYLVIANVAVGATVGHTFTGSIAAAGDVTASITPKGTAAGNQQTIATAIFDVTMTPVTSSESPTISSLVNDATISTTSQGAQVWQVTLSNPAGNAGAGTLSAVKFTQGANNGVANWATTIQAAELFDGSTALAAGSLTPTNISFTGLSTVLADGASKTLALRISLKSTPGALTDNSHFQFNLNGSDATVSGNGVTTVAINSDQTQNQITVAATTLAFTQVPTYVITNSTFTVQVSAQDANGNLDLDNTSFVTVSVATGGGTLTGGGSLLLTGGTKKWTTLAYDTVGLFSLTATDDNTVLTSATSANILARIAPTLTEVVMPQFMQGVSSSKRLPFVYRVALSNLLANATYRYYNVAVSGTDSANSTGAGNCIYANPAGFVKTSGPSLGSAGNYGSFITDANGSYSGWFISEPTGNARFSTAGNQVFMRIILNDGLTGTTAATYLTTPDSATVLGFGTTGANTGTGISGNSSATAKNFVLLYDNTAGTGRPLTAAFVEDDGAAENTAASYVLFYNNTVDGVPGAWGNIIPNSNANGIQRIEQRTLADGSLVGVDTAATGVWPSGANTVNPAGGDTTPVVITSTDAPLNSTGSVTTPVVTNIQVNGGNVLIDFTGGVADVVGSFTVVSSTDLTTAFTPVAATITTTGPGVFRASIPVNAANPAAFYRVKR